MNRMKTQINMNGKFLVIFAACIWIISCGDSNNLDRKKASSILSEQDFGKQYLNLDFGRFRLGIPILTHASRVWGKEESDIIQQYILGDEQESQNAQNKFKSFHNFSTRLLRNIQDVRYYIARNKLRSHIKEIKIIESKHISLGEEFRESIIVLYPNDLISPYCRNVKKNQSFVCKIETGAWKLEKVTGISGEGNRRLVEFNLGLAPTPIGELLGIKKSVKSREIFFTKYDDGWRIHKR